jgi:hypothetical protein
MTRTVFRPAIIALSALLLILSCANVEEDLTLKTQDFLKAYFSADYQKAGSFCTDSLGMELAKSAESFNSLEPSIKEMVLKQVEAVKTEVISIEKSASKDTLYVKYRVLLPSFPNGLDNNLSFVKVNKEWKVASLGS